MQEEKSFVYTLILGICMLLCLLMIGRMLLGHPEAGQQPGSAGPAPDEQEETPMGFQLDEDSLRALMLQALPFIPEQFDVQICADETISVNATVLRRNLADSGVVPGNLRTALLFLPDSCAVSACWEVTVQDSALVLRCRQAEIAGVSLPDEVTGALSEQIAAALNRQLAEDKVAPNGLQWEDGRLTLLT